LLLKKWFYTRCPGVAGAFPYYGTKVYFPRGSVIFDMMLRETVYERANVQLLRELVQPDTHYFDIGANIGLMSIPVLHAMATCRVLSYEPAPSVYSLLHRTAARSPHRGRWTVRSTALGSHVGRSGFFTSNAGAEAYGGFRHTQRGETHVHMEVPVSTVDAEWAALGRPRVSVIKIDVEGAELEVVQGAIDTIKTETPCILLEWNARNLEPYGTPQEALLKLAGSLDYRVFSVPATDFAGMPDGLTPVRDQVELEQQMLETESFLLAPRQAAAGGGRR
jgi:FkbM family methyltransferase